MIQHLLVKHARLRTRDCDEALGVLGRLWERHRVAITRDAYSIRWHQADLQRTSLTYIAHPCALACRCDGPLSDMFRVSFQRSGGMAHRINGRPAQASATAAVHHAPGQDIAFETSGALSVMMLSFDGGLVRRALGRRLRRLPPFESWAVTFSLASERVRLLRSLGEWLAAEMDRPHSILHSSPRVALNFERTLLSAYLECLAELEPHPGRAAADLDETRLRLVEAWIDANLDEPIGVEEMAAAVGTDVNAVAGAFRRLRGTTPLRALLQRRLQRARTLLMAAEDATTVTEVATSLGFFHFGRFAVRYRQQFGERPSDTLARRRRLC